MFAYVRFIRKKLLRALRATTGERGKRADFKFLTVRDLISAWTGSGYGNAAGAARGHYRGLRHARNGETRTRPDHVNKPNPTKSDQINQIKPDQGAGRWIKTGADEACFGSRALAAREL
jgi:hypothetical protein